MMMAALLVSMAVMAIAMTALMPAWRTMAQREKEIEMIFRAEQYARALVLYQKKMGPGTAPMTIDELVNGRFLRKKYKDPLTGDDFQVITTANPDPTVKPGTNAAIRAGIAGVMSKATGKAFRIYNGQDSYNQWVFTAVAMSPRMGGVGGPAGAQGRGAPSGPGGRGAPAGGGRGASPPPPPLPSPRGRSLQGIPPGALGR